MPNSQNVITYDRNYKQLIGCSIKQTEDTYSLDECLNMIAAMISIIKLKQQDYVTASAMLELALQDQRHGILMCADSDQIQSTFTDACISYFHKHGLPYQAVFENYSILHLLDKAVYASGMQIGSYIHTASLSKESILEKLIAAVLINEQTKNTHLLMPLTTYEHSCSFHKVHVLCMLEQGAKQQLTLIQSLAELEQYQLKHELFIGRKLNEQRYQLWKSICKVLFLNNTLIVKITLSKRRTASVQMKKIIQQLIVLIERQYDM